MESQSTKQFGRYEVIAELGRGAMGIVYKARDPQIDRLVAVKTVRLFGQEPEQEEEFRRRFVLEAQAAGRLQHPGIVAIYDVGEEGENRDPYIVLEYVAGESLSRLLSAQRKLALAQALQVAEEVADALDYAHGQGVVHRDIKPANILITEEGHAKITDFGIAKLNLAHFTLPGRVLGTPAYMAPEQLSGEGADGRSDLFSLGVILYTMVTGHPPFHGDSATTVCFKVANREPMPASTFNLELPRALDPVISRAMAKDPANRYQTGTEFANDIRDLRLQYTNSMTGSSALRSTTTAGGRAIRPATTGVHRVTPLPQQKSVEELQQLMAKALDRVSIRDLILGAAAVFALAFFALPVRRVLEASGKPVPVKSAAQSGVTPEEVSKLMEDAEGLPPDPGVVNNDTAPPREDDTTVSAQKAHSHRHLATSAPQQALRPVVTPVAQPTVATLSPAIHTASNRVGTAGLASSNVEILVQHQFKQATLTVWVDDKQVISRQLRGGLQRHMVVFSGIHGADSETVRVAPGVHTLRLRTQSSDFTVDLSKTITAEFASGADRTLQVTFDRHNTVMHLTWQ